MKRLPTLPVRGLAVRCVTLFAGLAVSAAGLVGCASRSGGSHPPAPTNAVAPDHRYKVGPLDVLNILVWRNPELSSQVTVRPDGRISVPLMEDLLAAGRNPSELAREIERGLSRVIREPSVTVVVSGFTGVFADQIRIVGEATRPQAIAYRQNMTVLDVMIQAGGLTDFADGNAAVLVRGSEGGKQYSVRLKDLLRRGDISANAAILPGDVIIVPQAWF